MHSLQQVALPLGRHPHPGHVATLHPPAWLGYRHTGEEHYLNAEGKLRKLNILERRKDAWKGFVSGLKNRKIDHFEDHIIDRYVDHIYFEALNSGDLHQE